VSFWQARFLDVQKAIENRANRARFPDDSPLSSKSFAGTAFASKRVTLLGSCHTKPRRRRQTTMERRSEAHLDQSTPKQTLTTPHNKNNPRHINASS
jgi:hypothetical protein